MANLGLPTINITFSESASTFINRSKKGTIGMILKGSTTTASQYVITKSSEIPSSLKEANKAYIERALIGGEEAPKKIIVYVGPSTMTDLTDALAYFETVKLDYLVIMPDADATLCQSTAAWINSERALGHKVKAVLPNNAANSKAIVNFASDEIDIGESTTLTTAQFCSRIAGLIVGTPLTKSVTYAVLPEVINVKKLTKTELDAAVGEGKLVLFNDGEKTKIARGVTSLTASNEIQAFKKIKLVETADMIENDIRKVFEDSYIGRVTNSYDNKCVLMSAIKTYLLALEKEGILQSGKSDVQIDIEAQSKYLSDNNIDISELTEQEIKEYNTGDKVFIKITIKMLDAIEDITINIMM